LKIKRRLLLKTFLISRVKKDGDQGMFLQKFLHLTGIGSRLLAWIKLKHGRLQLHEGKQFWEGRT
ncbi:hypothetical protein KI387_013545, partial [Taxus chinensis]